MCTPPPPLSRFRSCRVMSDMTMSAPLSSNAAAGWFAQARSARPRSSASNSTSPPSQSRDPGGDASAGLAAALPARTGRRHRAAQSMRCARPPSDLHPHGRIAGGFQARMRATPPPAGGARLDRTSHGSSCDQTAVFCPVGRASCPAGPRFGGGADEIILSTCCSTLILRPTRRTFPNR